jgi:hypothetical protein
MSKGNCLEWSRAYDGCRSTSRRHDETALPYTVSGRFVGIMLIIVDAERLDEDNKLIFKYSTWHWRCKQARIELGLTQIVSPRFWPPKSATFASDWVSILSALFFVCNRVTVTSTLESSRVMLGCPHFRFHCTSISFMSKIQQCHQSWACVYTHQQQANSVVIPDVMSVIRRFIFLKLIENMNPVISYQVCEKKGICYACFCNT